MKESICDLARESVVRDEQWRRHAVDCQDCSELLAVTAWMTELAESTSPQKTLPAPGYLLFKARLQERLSAADRAERPVHVMFIATGILLASVTTLGIVLGGKTRFGSIMIEAFGLLATYAWVILLAAVFVVAVSATAAYIGDLTKAERK